MNLKQFSLNLRNSGRNLSMLLQTIKPPCITRKNYFSCNYHPAQDHYQSPSGPPAPYWYIHEYQSRPLFWSCSQSLPFSEVQELHDHILWHPACAHNERSCHQFHPWNLVPELCSQCSLMAFHWKQLPQFQILNQYIILVLNPQVLHLPYHQRSLLHIQIINQVTLPADITHH